MKFLCYLHVVIEGDASSTSNDMQTQQSEPSSALDCLSENSSIIEPEPSSPIVNEQEHGLSKKEKAQRKKEMKLRKEKEKQSEKEAYKESLADLPSQREQELALLNQELLKEGLEVKNVAADGHCLYR